jgi:phosphoribosylformimino-5-aminoimidazole carboxamide ribonucleotide (ProFAR) isomerase
VNGVRDIELLAQAPIAGVVIGRALYDGRLDAQAALAAASR